jgi:hypothetical protein
MTEPTMIQVKAVHPRPPAEPAPAKPTVHVRSIGALAGNVAAAVGEGVFAVGGGVGLAAAAAAAVGVPLVVQGARGRLQRPTTEGARSPVGRGSSGGRSATSTSGRASRGGGSSGSAGATSGRLRKMLGAGGKTPGAAGGKTGTGTASGRGTAGAARSGGLPGGKRTGAGRGGSTTSPKAAARAARKAAKRAGSSGAPTTKLGRMLHNAQARHDGRWKRKAEKLGYQIAATARPPGRMRRGGAWARKRAGRAGKWAWRKLRRKPTTPATPATAPVVPKKGKKTSKVASTVRGGKAAKACKTSTPAPAPIPAPLTPTTAGKPALTPRTVTGGTMTGGPAPSAMKAMLDVIETDLRPIANNYDPEGIEEVIDEYRVWPEVLGALGGVWQIMVDKAEDDYPLSPAAAEVVAAIRQHQDNIAVAAQEVAGLIETLMRDELDKLNDKRNAMLDHRVNPNRAAI